jgi:hypothetical protein
MIAASTFSCSYAHADVCEAVLKHQAFDINDNSTNAEYRRSALDDLCKTRWSSRADFETKAQNLNTSGKYMEIFSGGLSGGQSETQETLRQDYDNLCTKNDYRVVSNFYSKTHVQSTDRAVDAWKACVLGTDGLWSAIRPTPDSAFFTLEVNFKPPSGIVGTPQGNLMLLGFTKDMGFTCKINNDEVTNYVPADHGLANHFILSCNLTTDQSAQVYVNTNYNCRL